MAKNEHTPRLGAPPPPPAPGTYPAAPGAYAPAGAPVAASLPGAASLYEAPALQAPSRPAVLPLGPAAAVPPAGAYPAAPGVYAPAGAPPAFAAPPPGAVPAPPQKRPRRVGTLTVALCLIAAGVLLVLRALDVPLDYILIARFAPAALILLGIELLVAGIIHREDKLRIDGLSVFVSLLLIAGSLAAAVVPQMMQYERAVVQTRRRLENELQTGTARALSQAENLPVYGIDWYIGVDDGVYGILPDPDMTPAEINPEYYVQVRVNMAGQYDGADDFALACRRVCDILLQYAPHIDYASFYSARDDDGYSGDIRYGLWLTNRGQLDTEAAAMAPWVEKSVWNADGGYYMNEHDYARMLAEKAEEEEERLREEEEQLREEDRPLGEDG